jgi:uncharacterized protein (UPF0264 family)
MTKSNNNMAKTGAGLAALGAAAAGAYYFFGKNGKKHQAEALKWANKAKGDVLKEVKKIKTFSKPVYDKAVSKVMSEYQKLKKLDPKDLTALTRELKSNYNSIAKEFIKVVSKKAPAKKTATKKTAK